MAASKAANAFLQQTAAQKERLFDGKARKFYIEICRCLPFIHRIMKLEEMTTLGELRAAVKDKFTKYRDVTDPRVVDMLIFKGREELETYLMYHKQRHHMITEYLEPYAQRKYAVHKPTGHTPFLDSFLDGNAAQIPSSKPF